MAQRDHTGQRVLVDGAVYSLALTACQYVARVYTGALPIRWVLVPTGANTGPPAYVTKDLRIGTQDGLSHATTEQLDFTGRYTHGHS
jgi:hypothetical protein